MPELKINSTTVEVSEGATILDAAGKLGIEIPTMCHREPYEPSSGCMVCLVKILGSGELVPACGRLAEEGMEIDTQSEEVIRARRAALELLLSDHLGDCVAPCQKTCPAGLDIPQLMHDVSSGHYRQAIRTVKERLPLPGVLGRLCNAPCENACRRREIDQPLAIRLLTRFVADEDRAGDKPWKPSCKPDTGRSVAIVGAGPAGLSAAYHLQQNGHFCHVFDDHAEPGGMLRYGVDDNHLSRHVLDAEIADILDLGIEFTGGIRIGEDKPFQHLRDDFDAILIATGKVDSGRQELFGLEVGKRGLKVGRKTHQMSDNVFAAGDVVRPRRSIARSIGDGRETALATHQQLSGNPVSGTNKRFNNRLGKLRDEEKEPSIFGAAGRQRVDADDEAGLTTKLARKEAERCLHCECRKPDNCILRNLADEYDAQDQQYRDNPRNRKSFIRNTDHDTIVYEPGKCIDCGLCIKIASEYGEETGLSFVGRGFAERVEPALGRTMDVSLGKSATRCVRYCPTGALAFKRTEDH